MVAVALVLLLLILAGALYDTARLPTSTGSRHALRPRRRRHGAVLEDAERRLVRQRLRGRIDAVTYRKRMRALAEGEHRPSTRRHG
ncbi:hypothetical protein [Streptomyces sp. S.PB5]|uniref:hypothetical protein n=1 Tax=Streptomyces sp. S.PB5 TaxID=3020844 RepID=UPI0025AFB316|nr:hypothetical protein [Streptomyces sp. S.PB5]MDN3029212.1 hypothetical protein [Streptomyces sp. S.PB5]